jgi:hypothetical protein
MYLSQFLAVGRVGSQKEFKKISKARRKKLHDLCSGPKQGTNAREHVRDPSEPPHKTVFADLLRAYAVNVWQRNTGLNSSISHIMTVPRGEH